MLGNKAETIRRRFEMRLWTLAIILILALTLIISGPSSPIAESGGSGSSGGSGGSGSSGDSGGSSGSSGNGGNYSRGHSMKGGGGDQKQQSGKGVLTQEQVRQHIQANVQQREQVRMCIQLADSACLQAQNMVQATKGRNFDIDNAKWERDRLQNSKQLMQEEHNRFMQGLTADQKAQMRERISNMIREQNRLNESFDRINKEFDDLNPNRNRISAQAREIERTMNNWRNQYQIINSEMEI